MPSVSHSERQARKCKTARRRILVAYALLTPYLLLMIMFAVFPVLYALGLSFFDTFDMVFWGLTNYKEALSDYRLVPAIWNVLQYVLVWVLSLIHI